MHWVGEEYLEASPFASRFLLEAGEESGKPFSDDCELLRVGKGGLTKDFACTRSGPGVKYHGQRKTEM